VISLANSQGVTDVNYYLEKLPDGYALFETDRTSGEGQSYKRLFGHPTGKYYDSAKRFQVHFKWLMSLMEGDCECVLCGSKKPPVVRRSEVFRFDPKTVSRPESRTLSRDLHFLQREDSSKFVDVIRNSLRADKWTSRYKVEVSNRPCIGER
jgi:hypothetical protein